MALRLLCVLSAAMLVGVSSLWIRDSSTLAFSACFAAAAIIIAYNFDYLNPAIAFLAPWLTVLLFSTLPVSAYSRNLDIFTCVVVLLAIVCWLLATVSAPASLSSAATRPQAAGVAPGRQLVARERRIVISGFVLLYLCALVNVAWSGYAPLIALITTGDSGYFGFGIPSVYGAFLAYSNALACVALYLFLQRGQRLYLLLFLTVLCMHLLFLSRQNLITLFIESFVLRCLVVERVRRVTMLLSIGGMLLAFSALGQLRSGDIGELMRVSPEFSWMPNSFLWLYAYSFFNVLNLENMIMMSGAPLYDGSMWQNLLPSVLRPETSQTSYLELETFNVSSYIYPIYLDVGVAGVMVITAFWGLVTAQVYRRALATRDFLPVSSYACLYGCALLSFFVDFWFYLPVIFQLVFFWIFHLLLFRKHGRVSEPARSVAGPWLVSEKGCKRA
jgi:oligosaccharide repeat unit polymerase